MLHTNSSLISQLKRDRNFILFVRKITNFALNKFVQTNIICLNPFTNVDMDTGQKAEALIQNIAQIGIGVLVLSHGHRYDSTGGAAQYLLDEQGMIRIN